MSRCGLGSGGNCDLAGDVRLHEPDPGRFVEKETSKDQTTLTCILLLLTIASMMRAPAVLAQDGSPDERWNLFWQATSIGQMHGAFPAAYTGPRSLSPHPEHEVSLTTTLFLGLRLNRNAAIYVNPEVAGGQGFSSVEGLANSPNGELPRVASATPKPYLARAYIQYDFGFGDERENVESDANQLAGMRPMTRYTIYAGRFTVTDFFDNNRYSHDPRSQFMGWAVMYNLNYALPLAARRPAEA
jgi:high affinity Mn2+ porin